MAPGVDGVIGDAREYIMIYLCIRLSNENELEEN